MFPEFSSEIELLVEYYNKLKKNSTIDSNTNCWLWNGPLSSGYGKIQIKYKNWRVHRVSAFIFLDFDPSDTKSQVNHKSICSNKHCWNPDHIYIGTQFDNAQDTNLAVHYGNKKYQMYCKHGHEYTQENTYYDPTRGYRQCKTCINERQNSLV